MLILQTRILQNGDFMELNFEGLEMQKWNILMDKTQRDDEKNGDICLVIMFIPGVMVITMSFFLFCVNEWCKLDISLR